MGRRARKKLAWPASVVGLSQRYGDELVYDAGVEVFGVPPTWEVNASELRRLKQKVNELDAEKFFQIVPKS